MADIKLPQLGESVTEGTLGKWLKNVGDPVAKYEPLVEITTDKVNAEVPSDFEGVLQEILVQEGETVKVGTVICRVLEDSVPASVAPVASVVAASPAAATAANVPSANVSLTGGRFSPAVLRLADEHQVDLKHVVGTGEGGRITRKDVLAFVESGSVQATASAAAGVQQSMTNPDNVESRSSRSMQPSGSAEPEMRVPATTGTSSRAADAGAVSTDDMTVIEPTAIRKTIARRMVESKHNAPHAWTMVEADVSQLVAFRTAAKKDFKRKEGLDLTFMPFFIKAVVEGLKQYPMLNSSWVNDQILMKHRINISIAVATDDALTVPVIHDADRLSIAGLAHATNELAARARAGRLTMADMQGGTFTVNNTGAFGSILSQPIINSPQAAILSFESIVKRPVVVNDAIAIRSMINLSLSLDHRVLDGWVAGQFLRAVKQRLESFGSDTVLY
ncbi:MAG: branched-chain alpha-keto acid dehydrogenase subunit E2 [Alicyclobacillus sp. RIFOXYA1_FULL_53_8]|nr:MAG: branched-chain alpha-keto acid dehydrogenase subunit E2 [Alicyclobacillus sp. RIFOXYA1_FULL_53_8]